jgi:protein-S-isoprenylcysteine O-methyltransferase Ste14
MEKLNFLGCGPKIARVAIPFLVVAIVLTIVYPAIFTFGPVMKMPLLIAGILLLAAGVICWAITVRYLLIGLKSTKLITNGPYALCRNPLYATILLLVVPGLSLVLNSWIILLTPVLAYIQFRSHIKTEYNEMEKFFGEAWKEYAKKTPELFPF